MRTVPAASPFPSEAAEPSAPSTGLYEEVGSLIGRTRRKVRGVLLARLGAEALDTWLLLKRLVRVGPATQRDLADATAQHPAAISRALERLEEQGLVRRTSDPQDRRRRVVEPTAAGLARFQALAPVAQAGIEEALARLNAADAQQLKRLLHKLLGDEA